MFPPSGLVVQLVRTLACHARGRGFDPHPGRQFASVAQSVEQRTENPRVVGSIPTGSTTSDSNIGECGFSSSGRAPPCQGGGSEFEPRNPLQRALKGFKRPYLNQKKNTAPWPSGKAGACKALIPSSILGGASKKLSFF